jgi:uncharacterized metal-binding protein
MDFPRCDRCGNVGCRVGEPGRFKSCPTNVSEFTRDGIIERYNDSETQKLMQTAAKVQRGTLQPVNGVLTPIRPRIAEIMAFADQMGWKKIGVAFCVTARDVGIKLTRVLEARGFEVCSIICRNFSMKKGELGIPKEDCFNSENESSCNPVYQAELLNDAETELNIVLGLCVGHDMLFMKNSKAFVTTLLVKDAMTANNPTGPLYSEFFSEILKNNRLGYSP